MNNQLLKTVTLPHNIVKGSYNSRQQKASNFTRELVGEILGQFNDDGISYYKLNSVIKKNLPENISFSIHKSRDKKVLGCISNNFNGNDQLCEYSFDSNFFSKNKMHILYFPLVAHEMRHLADSLFHPKFAARSQNIQQNIFNSEGLYEFYNENLYKKEKLGKNNTKEDVLKRICGQILHFLDGFSNRDSINMLQEMRYFLMSERNAYRQENRAAKILNERNIPVYKVYSKDETRCFMFDEKIELLKKMIAKYIDAERKDNALRIAKKKTESSIVKQIEAKQEGTLKSQIYFGAPPKKDAPKSGWFDYISNPFKSLTNKLRQKFSPNSADHSQKKQPSQIEIDLFRASNGEILY